MDEHKDTLGHVYAILFKNGLVKVGKSGDPNSRIASHKSNAAVHGNPVTNFWVSPLLTDMHEAESRLINYCSMYESPIAGSEWFMGLSYSDVVSFGERMTSEMLSSEVDSYEVSRMIDMLKGMGYVIKGPKRVDLELDKCLDKCFVFTGDMADELRSSEAYARYCEAGGELTQKQWLISLEEIGVQRKRKSKGTFLLGVRFKD